MKIVQEINRLKKVVKSLLPAAGKGLAIERTPSGTVYSLLDQPAGDGAWHGMFELIDDSKVEDGKTVFAIKVINGVDEESEICGVCHVNRQPFEVKVDSFPVTAEHSYVYLKFLAPEEGEEAIAAKVELTIETELKESTDEIVYHLLGQCKLEDEVLHIQQDHFPGNCYIEWYGPCLGLLEEKECSKDC